MPIRDEWDKLRHDRDAPRPPRPDPGGGGSPAFVGRVITTGSTYGGVYCLVHPCTVTGAEVEGGAGTIAVDTSITIPVYLLGPGAAQPGDDLVVRWADWRWVAERMGGGPAAVPTLTCSPCSIPKVDLHLSFTYSSNFSGNKTVAVTLTYTHNSVAPFDTWTGSVTLSDYPGGIGSHTFQLTCTSSIGGTVDLLHSWAGGGPCEYFGDGTGGTAFASSCSPFSLDWTSACNSDRRLIVTE